MYDPEIDIRDFYRARLREINQEIATLGRRDPRLHALWADRKLISGKLASLAATHQEPTGKLRDYGSW